MFLGVIPNKPIPLYTPISTTSSVAMDYPQNPNYLNPNYTLLADSDFLSSDFDLSNYLLVGDDVVDHGSRSQSMASSENIRDGYSTGSIVATSRNNNMQVAFRTKSELEVMDDGFKWRKYGKKAVKNSPNPRIIKLQ
ncbi:putative WRKY transcription factor 51 [Morella rubra]|uniref:Putative WRKY transcription factor 51 n=1 Tax=Morella rubra TaxID=262757 RepID=A0A6A1VEY3_9ROSI|nr:putative WRKY transcription factor 51 [Morella rubra]